jgi:hypothetical protein
MTSAVKVVPEMAVAVKQTPLTATESPTAISPISFGALMMKTAELSPFSIAVIEPSSPMSPVNITHHS